MGAVVAIVVSAIVMAVGKAVAVPAVGVLTVIALDVEVAAMAAIVVNLVAMLVAVVVGRTSRIDMALLRNTVAPHSVLKWLHHPLLKYVILLHSASSSHASWHASRLGSFPGDSSQ